MNLAITIIPYCKVLHRKFGHVEKCLLNLLVFDNLVSVFFIHKPELIYFARHAVTSWGGRVGRKGPMFKSIWDCDWSL